MPDDKTCTCGSDGEALSAELIAAGSEHRDDCPLKGEKDKAAVTSKIATATSDNDAVATAATLLNTEGHVWATRPELAPILEDLHGRSISVKVESIEALRARQEPKKTPNAGGVAVIPLQGMITPSGGLLAMLFGMGGGLDSFRAELRQAAADPEVNSIVLNVDSPGGIVDMVPETAKAIRDAGAQKPVVAQVNTTAGSAAYWLASQAHEIAITPSGEAGSIGVYQLHRNISAALEDSGIKVSIVRAGKYKIENNPYEPMTDEGRAAAQSAVNDYYDMFVKDVALGRGSTAEDVAGGFGEGRMLTAKRAVKAGLADRVATLDETVARLGSGRARVRRVEGSDRFGLEWADETETTTTADAEDEVSGYTPEEKDRLVATLAGLG